MTGYKIDIKSETQAIESGELPANYMDMPMEEGVFESDIYEDDVYEDDVYEDDAYEDGIDEEESYGMKVMNKKIPMRKCVGCGEMKNKKEMLRVIHTKEGEFLLDATGRKNGRGAYLCFSRDVF